MTLRRLRRWGALGLCLLGAGAARASTPEGGPGGSDAPLQPEARPAFKVVPAVVSVAPGLLLHGLGSLTAGDTALAGRLFLLQGSGLGLLAAGVIPIALTGASQHVIGPLYGLAIAGTGVFSVSMLSNLYAAVSPAFDPGVPALRLPRLELEAGYQSITDPSFSYRHFASLGARARLDRVRLDAGVRWAPGVDNVRVGAGAAYRLLGAPEGARLGAEGSALDVEAAVVVHRFPQEAFTLGGGEVFLRGRYDLARLGARLAGSFAEMGGGLAIQRYAYPDFLDDRLSQQLLFTFGFGVYLGRGGPFRGEALLYYDHRKDDFAGGIRGGAGVPGFLGLRARALLVGPWGASVEAQAGSALVGRVSLFYAWGGDS